LIIIFNTVFFSFSPPIINNFITYIFALIVAHIASILLLIIIY